MFQCSSASRKFLNGTPLRAGDLRPGFSALQRAENSSTEELPSERVSERQVSVLFSEPKIPQNTFVRELHSYAQVSVLFSEPKIPQVIDYAHSIPRARVSVLFSEPKIPQSPRSPIETTTPEFQCSSASRKFLNGITVNAAPGMDEVSVLFSEPKIPQRNWRARRGQAAFVSVLFSEPKIPQQTMLTILLHCCISFSALQRAENSSPRR